MNNMNLSDATKDDFIEFIAATFFRVQAIVYVLDALQSFVFSLIALIESHEISSVGTPSSSMIRNSVQSVLLSSVTSCLTTIALAVIFFFLAVPLARLIRRSLSHAWESKTAEAQI